jgi:hypothetical protein
MNERQAARVQKMTPQPKILLWVSVKRITDNGMADGRQVNPDLVRHPGFHVDFQQARATASANAPVTRKCFPYSLLTSRRSLDRPHSPLVATSMGQWHVHHSFDGSFSAD